MFIGSWKTDDLLTFTVTTHAAATGALTDADSVPTYRIYEDETGTAILTGSMAKLDDANTTGHYSEQVTLSAANGFEKGKSYNVYITATVATIAGGTTRAFQMEAEVDANVVSGGVNVTQLNGGSQSLLDLKDFADDGYDPAANKVNGVVTVDTLTTYTGNTLQTGDSFARIGAAGASLTAVPWNATWDAEVESEVADALGVVGVTLARMGALTDWIDGGRLDLILDAIAADVVNLDGAAMRGTDGANTVTPDNATITAIKVDTGNLVTRITATLFTGITSLAQWLGLMAGKQAGNATARTEVRATGAGAGTYDETTDAQEAIRDRGDSAWVTGAAGGDATAANQTTILANIAALNDFDPATQVVLLDMTQATPGASDVGTQLDAAGTGGGGGTIDPQDVRDAMLLDPSSGAGAPQVESIDWYLIAMKAKTDLISAGIIEVVSPVSADGQALDLRQGEAYLSAISNAVLIDVSHPAFSTAMLSDGTTVILKIKERHEDEDAVEIEGAITSVDGTTASVSFDVPASVTSALAAGDNAHRFDLDFLMGGDSDLVVSPIVDGQVNVKADI